MASCMSMQSEYQFKFKDFVPVEIGRKEYQSLPTLIESANNWLRCKSSCAVKTCETFNIKIHRTKSTSPEIMSYSRQQDNSNEHSSPVNKYLRCLRLWLTSFSGNVKQFIACRTYCIEFSSDGVEILDSLLNKINYDLTRNPIQGKIISVETKPVLFDGKKHFDPSKTYWKERGYVDNVFVFVVRVFYIYGESLMETVEFKDYAPVIPGNAQGKIIKEDLYTVNASFESLLSAFERRELSQISASSRITNMQTLDIKMKMADFKSNRQIMKYMEHCGPSTRYWRILRVVIVTSTHSSPNVAIPSLSYKTFTPVLLTTDLEFETMSDTFSRVDAWLSTVRRSHNITIVCAETLPIRYNKGTEKYYGAEATWTVNKSNRTEVWMYIIKIYFYGKFIEPPTDWLPKVPPVLETNSDTCTML